MREEPRPGTNENQGAILSPSACQFWHKADFRRLERDSDGSEGITQELRFDPRLTSASPDARSNRGKDCAFTVRLGKAHWKPVSLNFVSARGLPAIRTMKWSNAMWLNRIPFCHNDFL